MKSVKIEGATNKPPLFGQNNSLGEFYTLTVKANLHNIILMIHKDQFETSAAKLGVHHSDIRDLKNIGVEITLSRKD